MIQYYIQSEPNESFTLLIDTTKAGTPVGFTIPTTTGTYLYEVDWGDGITTTNHTGSTTHTYASNGIYQVRITGTFPIIYFNNTGDKLKVIGILNWGQTGLSTDQSRAFYGLKNLTGVPTASDAWYNSITTGTFMFRDTSLTNLPSNMTLGNLTSGSFMFYLTNLQSLPSSLTLDSLITGNSMFRNTLIETLPAGMTLGNLTNGGSMFQDSALTSLPSGMTLGNLTNGSYMFYQANLQTLPSSLTLASLTSGSYMFQYNSLTDLPSGITLANLTNGTNMFFANTINTARYSQLLIDMNANNSNNNVVFHGGNSKYNPAGGIARKALLDRGWTITDGGPEV